MNKKRKAVTTEELAIPRRFAKLDMSGASSEKSERVASDPSSQDHKSSANGQSPEHKPNTSRKRILSTEDLVPELNAKAQKIRSPKRHKPLNLPPSSGCREPSSQSAGSDARPTNGSSKVEYENSPMSEFPVIETEDITEEVNARLAAKEQQRKDRLTKRQQKRKRQSMESLLSEGGLSGDPGSGKQKDLATIVRPRSKKAKQQADDTVDSNGNIYAPQDGDRVSSDHQGDTTKAKSKRKMLNGIDGELPGMERDERSKIQTRPLKRHKKASI